MEPKQKQYQAVDVTGDRNKAQCCREQYCIGTWNIRSTNQGKLEVVKQEMARVNVDILRISELKWSSELNSPIPVHFSLLIPKIQCSFLPSPVWPLPICLDSWTWHSRFLCNIVLYSIGLYFHHQTHPQLNVVSALAQSLHSSGAISPLFSSSMRTPTDLEGSSFSVIFSPFHAVHGVLKARMLKWLAILLSSWPHFFRGCRKRPR